MADIVGGSVTWNLDADNAKFNQQLDKASSQVKSLDGRIKAAESGSKAFAAGLAVVGAAAVGFGVSAVRAYESAQVAQTKLSTNLLNVKGNTQATVNELGKLASSLQNVGVIEDDVIKAGMSQLATFNLQGKTIGMLTPKIADMVAQLKGHNATAEDMVGINNLVGKVMTGNVGALSRYGVTLSETQAKLLKTGTETERANILNQVLAQNYGKVNEALRNTPQGQITAFKNTFGDFQEILGETIIKGLTPFIKNLNDLMAAAGGPEGMMKKLTETFAALQPWLPVIAGVIVGALIPAVIGLGGAFITMMIPLLPFIAVGAAVGLAFMAIKKAIEVLAPTMQMIGEVVSTTLTAIQTAFAAGFNFIKDSIVVPILEALKGYITIVFGAYYNLIMGIWNTITNGTKNAWSAISNAVTGPINAVRNSVTNALNAVGSTVTNVWNNIYNFLANMAGRIVDAITKPFRDAYNTVARIAEQIKNAANKINPFHRESPSLVDNVTRGLGIIKSEFEALGNLSLPSVAGLMPSADFATATAPNFMSDSGSGATAGGNQNINVYIDKVGDQIDVDSMAAQLGFRASLAK